VTDDISAATARAAVFLDIALSVLLAARTATSFDQASIPLAGSISEHVRRGIGKITNRIHG
jgi:hypothetical protein